MHSNHYYGKKKKKDGDWLKKEDKIKGFEWRGGSDQVTSGIHIWSKPFVFQNKSGKRVCFIYVTPDF